MMTRSGSEGGSKGETTTTLNGNKRRAFRDVTNANRSGHAHKARRHGGIEKRASARGNKKIQIAVDVTAKQPQPLSVLGRGSRKGAGKQRASGHRPVTRSRSTSSDTKSDNKPSTQHVFANSDPESYQYTGKTDKIDEHDCDDPLAVTNYVEEMYSIFREKEAGTSVRPVYMENQPHINERMRAILVDWLVEVHLKFKLVPETLYLTINLIDRFLERTNVNRPRLQLVGVSALLIASKYEEIYPPDLRDLVYICDRAYTRRDILDMEENILKTLNYQITIPSAHAFLVRFLKAAHADKKIVQLSCYILDGTLQSYELLHYLPSQLAAAAVVIARHSVGRNAWSPTLLKYAQYCEEDLLPIAREVLKAKSSSPSDLRAVHKKYSSSRFGCVSDDELQCDF